MNLFVSRKLKALGYPKDITSMEVKIMSDIVCFLEDRIIRHYEIKERDSLRNEKEFPNAFDRYCRDLECPMRILKSKNIDVKLQWLIIYATLLAFEERKTSAPVKMKPKIEEIVNELAKAAGIQQEDTSTAGLVHTLQAVENELQKHMKKPSKHHDLRFLTEKGFTTGSNVLDSAGTILRMLYIEDLRELQNQVNSLLVQVQEFTGNPKTDSSLGRVGR